MKLASTAARSGERLQRELQLAAQAAQSEALLGWELGVNALWRSKIQSLASMRYGSLGEGGQ